MSNFDFFNAWLTSHPDETIKRFSALEVHQSSPFGNLNFHTHSTKCRLWTFLPEWVKSDQKSYSTACVVVHGVFFCGFCFGVGSCFFLFHPPLPLPPASEYLVHWEDRYCCSAVAFKLVLQTWSLDYVTAVLSVLHWMKYLVEQGAGSAKFSSWWWWYGAAFLVFMLTGWSNATRCSRLVSLVVEIAAVSYSYIACIAMFPPVIHRPGRKHFVKMVCFLQVLSWPFWI